MSTARLLISWEPSWAPEGLGVTCLHLELEGVGPEAVTDLVGTTGSELLQGERGPLLRLPPTVDLATICALLRRAGWSVDELVPDRVAQAERR
jgi:hypothetical protein